MCASIDAYCQLIGVHERDMVCTRPDGNYLHPQRFSKEVQRTQLRYITERRTDPSPSSASTIYNTAGRHSRAVRVSCRRGTLTSEVRVLTSAVENLFVPLRGSFCWYVRLRSRA